MKPELHEFLQQASLDQQTIKRVAELLPPDDPELDRCIEEAIENGSIKQVEYLTLAALVSERPVDARHLAKGLSLFDSTKWLPEIALRMRGDVAKVLVESMDEIEFDKNTQARALCIAAVWCVEHGGGVFPGRLIPMARRLARHEVAGTVGFVYLLSVAVYTKDQGLLSILKKQLPTLNDEQWKGFLEFALPVMTLVGAVGANSLMDGIPVEADSLLAQGSTMRRAVVRVGRNEPCPCGSGRKYKQCCFEKDQERLHHSSDVQGVTQEELELSPEPFLTSARLRTMEIHQLGRLDPTKIPATVLPAYFERLAFHKLLDRLIEGFEQVGYSDNFSDAWDTAVMNVTTRGEKTLLQRLLKLRTSQTPLHQAISLAIDLLLSEDDPGKCLELIESAVISAFRDQDNGSLDYLTRVASSLSFSRFPALAIAIWRTLLPFSDRSAECWLMLYALRDRLNLAPEDPLARVIEKLTPNDEEEAIALNRTRRQLEAERAKFRQAQEIIQQMQKENKRRHKASPSQQQAAADSARDARAEKDLREKIEFLTAEVKREHTERNIYRRKLENTEKVLQQVLREVEASSPEIESEADPEDDFLPPEEGERNDPLRIIDFPRNFQEKLNELPRHIARNAMMTLGGIAAGDPASFVGALRLKTRPDVMRQRIGADYRLLFRLSAERVEVIDLCPRQELDRKIKTLAAHA